MFRARRLAGRLWWRLRLDWNFGGDTRARALLEERLAAFIPKALGEGPGILAARYNYDGRRLSDTENPGALGTLAWALDEMGPGGNSAAMELRNRLTREHMTKNLSANEIYFGVRDDYYVNTWAWYGLAQDTWAFPFAALPPPVELPGAAP